MWVWERAHTFVQHRKGPLRRLRHVSAQKIQTRCNFSWSCRATRKSQPQSIKLQGKTFWTTEQIDKLGILEVGGFPCDKYILPLCHTLTLSRCGSHIFSFWSALFRCHLFACLPENRQPCQPQCMLGCRGQSAGRTSAAVGRPVRSHNCFRHTWMLQTHDAWSQWLFPQIVYWAQWLNYAQNSQNSELRKDEKSRSQNMRHGDLEQLCLCKRLTDNSIPTQL